MRKIPKVILLIDTTRSYRVKILRGIAKYFHLHGPWIFYREFSGSDKISVKKQLNLDELAADGVVAHVFSIKEAKKILALGLPTVLFGNIDLRKQFPNVAILISDDVAYGKMAAEHYLERGFRRFAYCGIDTLWSNDRGQGF